MTLLTLPNLLSGMLLLITTQNFPVQGDTGHKGSIAKRSANFWKSNDAPECNDDFQWIHSSTIDEFMGCHTLPSLHETIDTGFWVCRGKYTYSNGEVFIVNGEFTYNDNKKECGYEYRNGVALFDEFQVLYAPGNKWKWLPFTEGEPNVPDGAYQVGGRWYWPYYVCRATGRSGLKVGNVAKNRSNENQWVCYINEDDGTASLMLSFEVLVEIN